MSVKTILPTQLRTMKGQEGLILQGCGGSLYDWVDGINELLTREGILKDGTKFHDCVTFEFDKSTCLLFPFAEDVKLDSQLPKRSARAEEQAGEMELPAWRLHSFQKVEDRYAIETELMMHIAEGNEKAAISALQKLLHTSRPQVGMEVDLWPQQAASAIMRNMIRLAAKRSGLHAAIIDGVCVDYAQKMRQLSGNPIAEAKMYANLISDLCKEIRLMQGNGYSALTQQALFFLHKYYAETFSVGELAQMLHVSESTLSRTLKADTGRSFSQLLKEERMQNAARLLCSTSDSIQTIAGKVGISDPNYFVKVFRSVYRTTPGAYRQNAVLGEAEKLRKC